MSDKNHPIDTRQDTNTVHAATATEPAPSSTPESPPVDAPAPSAAEPPATEPAPSSTPAEPAPGSTARAKEPLPASLVKTPRPRKPLTKDGLATAEATLRAKYPHIIEGSLRNATKNQPTDDMDKDEVAKFHHKRSVRIHCKNSACRNTRRIATSDLAQVAYCEDCTRANRNTRKRERRAKAKQK